MDNAEEAVGQLVVAGGDGAVDLEVAEHALNAVPLLVGVGSGWGWNDTLSSGVFRSLRCRASTASTRSAILPVRHGQSRPWGVVTPLKA